MESLREDILAAAEALIEEEGVEALSVRALAARTNWGKSSVQTMIGSKDELLDAVADRVMERHIQALTALAGGPEDTSDGRFRTTAGLIIDSPNLATAMFGRRRPDDLTGWSKRWVGTFSQELATDLDTSDERALAEALYLSHQQIVTVIPTIAESRDVEFGGRLLRSTFGPFSSLAREFDALGATEDPQPG